jgi:hypothetical protein
MEDGRSYEENLVSEIELGKSLGCMAEERHELDKFQVIVKQ